MYSLLLSPSASRSTPVSCVWIMEIGWAHESCLRHQRLSALLVLHRNRIPMELCGKQRKPRPEATACPVAHIHNNVVDPAPSSHSLTSDKRPPVTVKAWPLWYLLSFLNVFFHWITFSWCDVKQTWGKFRIWELAPFQSVWIWIELDKELFATRLNCFVGINLCF